MLLEYVVLGVIGAATRILVHIHNYGVAKVRKDRALAHLGLGGIFGYVSYLLVTIYGWTNHLTALSMGYMAPSVAEHLLKKGEIGTEAVYEP